MSLTDAGLYSCNAANHLGTATKSFQLSVYGKKYFNVNNNGSITSPKDIFPDVEFCTLSVKTIFTVEK